jgi:hypothetical protein
MFGCLLAQTSAIAGTLPYEKTTLSFERNARRPLLLLLRALIAFRFLEGKGRALGVRIVVVYCRDEEPFDG